MSKSFLFLFGRVVMMTLGQACGDDDVDCASLDANQQEVIMLIEDLNDAIDNFNVDQSDGNCIAVRSAFDELIDFSESTLDCFETDAQRQLAEQQLDDARGGRDALPC